MAVHEDFPVYLLQLFLLVLVLVRFQVHLALDLLFVVHLDFLPVPPFSGSFCNRTPSCGKVDAKLCW